MEKGFRQFREKICENKFLRN